MSRPDGRKPFDQNSSGNRRADGSRRRSSAMPHQGDARAKSPSASQRSYSRNSASYTNRRASAPPSSPIARDAYGRPIRSNPQANRRSYGSAEQDIRRTQQQYSPAQRSDREPKRTAGQQRKRTSANFPAGYTPQSAQRPARGTQQQSARRVHPDAAQRQARRSDAPMGSRPHPTQDDRYRDESAYRARRKSGESRRRPFLIVAVVVLVILIGGGSAFGLNAMQKATVTVNGKEVTLDAPGTVQTAYDSLTVKPEAGDLLDITGSTLEAGNGELFTADVNGTETTDPAHKLYDGDVVAFSTGHDTTESFTESTRELDANENILEKGAGPLHIVVAGEPATESTKTGDISGKTETEKSDAKPKTYLKYYPDTNGEKVIALTFDDGPWLSDSNTKATSEVLDVLEKYDAKATFFTVGNYVEKAGDKGVDLLNRERSMGCQIASHSYDHASGSGGSTNMSKMSTDEQIGEVSKWYDVMNSAIGEVPSRAFRAPGGNFPLSTWQLVEDDISVEVGWNIDSVDWKKPGAEAIAEQLKSVTPGDVVLCHDGGGDRTQTVEALKIALPYLKEKGYRFITIDEMMEYPIKDV